MKNLIYTFVIVLVVGTLNAQWVQVPSGTIENLNEIQFVDANTGFAVGNAGVVLKTTNGGQNWFTINTGFTNNNSSLFFLNLNTGFISNYNNIIKTTNNGNNWTIISNNSDIFTSMYFIDQNTGFGTVENLYRGLEMTTNGGVNWYSRSKPYCRDIKFLNNTFGYCISLYYDTYGNWVKVLTTTSSGNTWDSHDVYSFTNTSAKLNAIDFISTTIGYTVGDSGKIYKTLNGGNNWSYQNSNTTNVLKSIKAIDLNNVITVGNNGIIKASTNGGTTWFTQNSPTPNNLNSLYMVNASTGFIAGDVGTILKTTNGGVWVKKIDEIIPQHYELEQNYPNPFNPSTTIRFSIPKQDFVKITIYNLNGKIISNLIENILTAGTYETTFDASELSSGVYFVKFIAGKTSITKKISFIK